MYHFFSKQAVWLAFYVLAWPALSSSQTVVRSAMFQGVQRSYRLHLPQPMPPGPLPLVLCLHGLGSNSLEQEFYTQFSPLSDTEGFMVAYPDGVAGLWNIGILPTSIDDLSFLSDLADTLAKTYPIDASRIYSCGFSMGGFMSYRLACERPNRFAAVGSVAGLMAASLYAGCDPDRPVPAIHIHGDQDDVVPLEGGTGYPGINALLTHWLDKNGCPQPPDTFELPDFVANDQSTCVRYAYSPCRDSTSWVYWKVLGGGHTWPGAFPLPNLVTNQDLRASRAIWEFFAEIRHPDPAPLATSLPSHRAPLATWRLEPAQGLIYHSAPYPLNYRMIDLSGRVLSAGLCLVGMGLPAPPPNALYVLAWEGGGQSGVWKFSQI